MRARMFAVIAALALAAALLPAAIASGTRTQPVDAPWPMFHHDAQHTGQSPYLGPMSPVLKWRYATGGAITSSQFWTNTLGYAIKIKNAEILISGDQWPNNTYPNIGVTTPQPIQYLGGVNVLPQGKIAGHYGIATNAPFQPQHGWRTLTPYDPPVLLNPGDALWFLANCSTAGSNPVLRFGYNIQYRVLFDH